MKRLLLSLLFVNYASCQHQPTAVPTESLPAVSNTPSSTNLPNDSSTSKAADEIPTTTFSYITPIDEQYDGFGFDNPSKSNGRMITFLPNTIPRGLGEPLNAIISSHSDDDVLFDNNGGYTNWLYSLNFSTDCLGIQNTLVMQADLGDGNGKVNQKAIMRENFGNPFIGNCRQTANGGNKFRYWTQESTDAIFMAVSYEKGMNENYAIVVDGYNKGRDLIAGVATNTNLYDNGVTNNTISKGTTDFNGWYYMNTVSYISGLLLNSSKGINQFDTVVENENDTAIDGLVALFDVQVLDRPSLAILSSIPSVKLIYIIILAIIYLVF